MQTVTIFGGGYAGATLAQALKGAAEITVVSPLDYFEVPMALPRNLVEPAFATRSVVPFGEALPHATHIRAKLVEFGAQGAVIEHPDGRRESVSSDLSVLATGSRYGSALTRAQDGTAATRRAEFQSFAKRLSTANAVVIVGGGPIGVELAGEIVQDYPGKTVTIIESNRDILRGTSRKVAAHAKKALEARGVTFIVGQRVVSPAMGQEVADAVRTDAGQEIAADLIYWAVGARPNTEFFPSDERTADGLIPVDEWLRVKGYEGVYALGDIADVNEVNKALYIMGQVKVVAKNIRANLAGRPPSKAYKRQTGNEMMVVTLGRRGGVAHLPGLGKTSAGWFIRMAKSTDMLVGMYRKAVGASKS